MRKVIYKEWVRGVDTEEAKQKPTFERSMMQPHHRYKKGTNCYIEKPGFFHGLFTTFQYVDGTTPMPSPVAIIEKEDGCLMETEPSLIRFVDSPESEQLAEFAKAAMQGLCSSFVSDRTDRDEYNYAAMSVMIAKATIAELKKQKP